MSPTFLTRHSRAAASVLCPILAFALVACGQTSSPPESSEPPAAEAPKSPADTPSTDTSTARKYTVRAEVKAIEDSEEFRGILVAHEAIDNFEGLDGQVWGMDAMLMAFPVVADADLTGIEPDDKVEITLSVDWLAENPDDRQVATGVRELPADTELIFRKAIVPGSNAEPELIDIYGAHAGHAGGPEGMDHSEASHGEMDHEDHDTNGAQTP